MSVTSVSGPFVSRWIVPRLLYFPQRIDAEEGRPSRHGQSRAREVWIPSGDARLHGWWTPPEDRDAGSSPRSAVVYLHGNAGCLVGRAFIAERFAREGFGTLLVDYRGYGRSTGRPDEAGLYRDGRASRRWVVDEIGIPPRRLALVGHSLGAPVAARTAADRKVGAVALSAPPTSIPELAGELYPLVPRWLLRGWSDHRFETVSHVTGVTCPVLVSRGDVDRLVPRHHADRVHAAAASPGPRYEAPGAGHNDAWHHPGHWQVHLAFLREALEGT